MIFSRFPRAASLILACFGLIACGGDAKSKHPDLPDRAPVIPDVVAEVSGPSVTIIWTSPADDDVLQVIVANGNIRLRRHCAIAAAPRDDFVIARRQSP